MKKYPESCSKNLFENSLEKYDYEIALKEWYFLDEIIDNNEYVEMNTPRPSCELCEHEDLRWQFIIYNVNNNNQLKVGSSCIKQFDIALIDKNDNKVYGKERNSKINKLIALQRIKSSNKLTFQAINNLCKIKKDLERNKMFIECWTQLKVNGTLEPKLALFLINNFIECNIDYKEIDLRIDLKKKKCNDQINRMSKNVYNLIRLFLSDKEIEYYDNYFDKKQGSANCT